MEQLVPCLSESRLWMRFSERTLTSLADFGDWHAAVGLAYRDQSHTIERLAPEPAPGGTIVKVIVVWRAVQVTDGRAIAARAHQTWRLVRSPFTAEPTIERYEVEDLQSLPA